jgi:hypothetical protein
MSLAKNAVKALLRRSTNALIASSSSLPIKLGRTSSSEFPPTLMKYLPYPAPERLYVLRKPNVNSEQPSKTDFPIPSESFLDGYKTNEWLSSGKENVDTMMRVLHNARFSIQNGNRILDFGCSSGRMIRWLAECSSRCPRLINI